MNRSPDRPRIGIAVLILRDGEVLLGQRLGGLGAGTWAPPGGHLEFGESIEDCARREVREETGLELVELARGPYTSDVFAAEGRHYVTLFMTARAAAGDPRALEPDKCARWQWCEWTALPAPLFPTFAHLLRTGFVP